VLSNHLFRVARRALLDIERPRNMRDYAQGCRVMLLDAGPRLSIGHEEWRCRGAKQSPAQNARIAAIAWTCADFTLGCTCSDRGGLESPMACTVGDNSLIAVAQIVQTLAASLLLPCVSRACCLFTSSSSSSS
jgi:hypothetical protein